MLGGYGGWLFSTIAGLSRQPGSASWGALDFAPPQPLPPSLNLTSASATVDTPLGLAEVAWSSLDASAALCGRVSENAALPNGTSLTLRCAGGGVFSAVAFASFGTPGGASCPYAINATCHAPASSAVVAALCLGRAQCTIPATAAAFGGDPCPLTRKALAVQLEGSCAGVAFELQGRVPVGGRGRLRLPLGGRDAAAVNVTEGGVLVWARGQFVPGVAGVRGASAGEGYVSLDVGSGEYALALVVEA
jgi:hypothetical protein